MADEIDIIAAYDAQAPALVAEYESLDPCAYRSTYSEFLGPSDGRKALDVGAGSGRDAAWLASLGFQVTAIEPAKGMREAGQRLHQAKNIRWIDDRLPELAATSSLNETFDVIILSAVWQHVAPQDRSLAFDRIASLLQTAGLLVITLRRGPFPRDRPMFSVSADEIIKLASEQGLQASVIARNPSTSRLPGVTWTTMRLRRPKRGGRISRDSNGS